MWIIGRNGFLALEQHPNQPDSLTVRAQDVESLDYFVALLNESSDGKHEVEKIADDGFRFETVALKETVVRAVAKEIASIDYPKFQQSVTFDFGADLDYCAIVGKAGVQIARLIVPETGDSEKRNGNSEPEEQ